MGNSVTPSASRGAAPTRVDACSNGAGHTSNVDPELVEAVARRVVELLREEGIAPGVLVDAAKVAEALGRRREWVYRHADELGAHRIGGRPMFDLARVTAVSHEQRPSTRSRRSGKRKSGNRAGARKGTGTELLPIGGEGFDAS